MSEMSSWTPRELAAAVTPLFALPGRRQQEALNELVIRCEVADRVMAANGPRLAEALTKPTAALSALPKEDQ